MLGLRFAIVRYAYGVQSLMRGVRRHEKRSAIVTQEMTTPTLASRRSILAPALAASIVIAWFVSAKVLDQSFLAAQTSRQLLSLGAANGVSVQAGEWWRLLTSQFLHVHAAHMLFNALGVGLASAVLERRYGWATLALLYFMGGTAGQLASVLAYPGLVSSGASQALMALCGAAVVARLHPRSYVVVALVLAVQVVLDIQSVQAIKAGHAWAFAVGLAAGAIARMYVSGQGENHVAEQTHAASRDR
jgi:rhomboid protease GluP